MTPAPNCECAADCESDRLKGCQDPHTCAQEALQRIYNIKPKLNSLQPNGHHGNLSLTKRCKARNTAAIQNQRAVLFNPSITSKNDLAECFRVFTEPNRISDILYLPNALNPMEGTSAYKKSPYTLTVNAWKWKGKCVQQLRHLDKPQLPREQSDTNLQGIPIEPSRRNSSCNCSCRSSPGMLPTKNNHQLQIRHRRTNDAPKILGGPQMDKDTVKNATLFKKAAFLLKRCMALTTFQ